MDSDSIRSAATRRTPAGLLTVLLVIGATLPAGAIGLAREGRALMPILLAADPSAAENTAARELADYLERISGARFEVLLEDDVPDVRRAIHVGPTALALEQGLGADRLGPEEWAVRTTEAGLILTGGRPRGTLYAVYRFLEDELGVRWWTPFEEWVPRRDRVVLGRLERRGRPVFGYRDVHGIRGPRAFCARNRINGHFSKLGPAHGGAERYGPPSHVHTFFRYVPPEEHFESHPEYFSEKGGLRYADRGQLCLTNPELFELVAGKLESYVEQSREQASSAGRVPPRLFDFSHNDWGGRCRCDACSRIAEEEGGHSGPLVRFLNRLAERHPDVWIDTLAYSHTFDPPRHTSTRDNVVVRLSALYQRDFSKPVAHPSHEDYRRALAGWSERTRHLRVWDYTVTFGDDGDLPLPNLSFLADDLRFYAEQGVEGMFVQHSFPIAADMRDMKLWVLLKLLEDPSRSTRALIRDFSHGYYGPAARPIRRYLRALEHAAARKAAVIRFYSDADAFTYLDVRFMLEAHRLFDAAQRKVAGDPVLSRRVRHARLSLDRATLARWRALGNEAAQLGARIAGRPPDLNAITTRYRRTWQEQMELRLRKNERARAMEDLDSELRRFRARAR